MKKKLTIICTSQFGYLIDTYYYALHLKGEYDIRYICINAGKPLIEEEGIEIININIDKNGALKWLDFVKHIKPFLKERDDLVFVKYFRFCSLLRTVVPKKCFIMDVRTGSIDPKWFSRMLFNKTLKFESYFAQKINVISDSLGKLLKLKNYNVVGLGSPEFTTDYKTFDTIRLLYVGTLSNRKITDTLVGLKKHLDQNHDHIIESYDIVGDGYINEVADLKSLVTSLGLSELVKVHGRIPHNQLTPFFERCNIGVSYVPKTTYYDVQPVTKALEYIANGMFVIGTSTTEQIKILNQYNGELCEDNPQAFAEALSRVTNQRHKLDSDFIRKNTTTKTWNEISSHLKLIIES
ncbi:glycosyltransferase [Colwellia sp. TT2012]|uniref:glycosyltransferase n=1 Tax=Colwellia sp. TT2012 TaxID=1720342 RepID=UPI00070F0C48|nr:glycosyltransferase [Colwellia sp. TT2012]